MEIEGRVINLLPIQKGLGKNGIWKSQDFVIETRDQYPKKVCIGIFGDPLITKAEGMKEGMNIKAHINLESREYNGRWYTQIRAWKLEWSEESAKAAFQRGQAGHAAQDPDPEPAKPSSNDNDNDDLPF
jgi:hypothetical protein